MLYVICLLIYVYYCLKGCSDDDTDQRRTPVNNRRVKKGSDKSPLKSLVRDKGDNSSDDQTDDTDFTLNQDTEDNTTIDKTNVSTAISAEMKTDKGNV